MLSTQAYHDSEFLKEVWGLYGVGVLILTARTCVRLRSVGVRGFQGDDWITLLVFLCYTADAVTVDLTYRYGSNVDYGPARLAEFTKQEINQIEFGGRMQLLAWYTYTALVWFLKGCMLFFFNRLTLGLDSHTWVKRLGVVCVLTYVAVFLTITFGCRPYHLNWQALPVPPPQCTLRAQNMYVSTTLNVITDGMMLAIPVPLLWKLQVPLKRKLTLAALFSSGLFVITAALVRITMTLKAHPSALTINRWGVRETIAGIIAVNLPILKPLFTKTFWVGEIPGRTLNKPSTSNGKSSGSKVFSLRKPAAFEMVSEPDHAEDAKSHTQITTRARRFESHDDSDANEDASSQDFIVHKSPDPVITRQPSNDVEMGWAGVRVEKTYEIRPAANTDGAQLPSHRAVASGPASWEADRPWESWSRMQGHHNYGHSATVRTSSDLER